MRKVDAIYRDRQLTAIEQAGGLWHVEISASDGQPELTECFASLEDAMAAARRTIDRKSPNTSFLS